MVVPVTLGFAEEKYAPDTAHHWPRLFFRPKPGWAALIFGDDIADRTYVAVAKTSAKMSTVASHPTRYFYGAESKRVHDPLHAVCVALSMCTDAPAVTSEVTDASR